jgi:hypothetical protein
MDVSSLTSMPDFAVVALLGELVTEVHGSAWPLHLTLAIFDADADAATVAEAVTQLAASVAPFDIAPGPRADFGPNRDVPITLVAPDAAPRDLHLLLVEMVTAAGWHMRDPYWGAQFAPHVTNSGVRAFTHSARVDSIQLYEHLGGDWLLHASCPLAPGRVDRVEA